MLWTFTNTTRYKPILGGFVGVAVLDYYQQKERLKMDCRACEGDCVKWRYDMGVMNRLPKLEKTNHLL